MIQKSNFSSNLKNNYVNKVYSSEERNKRLFMQDENVEPVLKYSAVKQDSRYNDKEKERQKRDNMFDLQKMKKEFDFIQLKNNRSQETKKMGNTNTEKDNFIEIPSFKKQKSQQVHTVHKKSNKVAVNLLRSNQQTSSSGNKISNNGFTDRISQLVKMRQQHQKIINSLVCGKITKKLSGQKQSANLNVLKRKNTQLEKKYIKVVQEYSLLSSQRIERVKNQNQESHYHCNQKYNTNVKSPKRQYVEYENNQISNSKINQIDKLKFKPDQNINYTEQICTSLLKKLSSNKKPVVNNEKFITQQDQIKMSRQNNKSSNINTQLSNSQYIQQPIEKQLQTDQQSQQTSSQQHNFQQINEFKQVNESRFQMQEHINLMASLSQFQVNSSRPQIVSPLQNSLYFSLINLIDNKFKHHKHKNSQFQLTYAGGSQTNQQNFNYLIKAIYSIRPQNTDFIQMVKFITENQFWQGLLNSEQKIYQNQVKQKQIITQYHGLCFNSGNYVQILLTDGEITVDEEKLLILYKSKDNIIKIDITLVLLSRLIDVKVNKTFPQMLNRLFGYQFKTFDILRLNKFTQFLDYVDRLRQVHQKQLRNENGIQEEDKLNNSFQRRRYSQTCNEKDGNQNDITKVQLIEDKQKTCDFEVYARNKTTKSFQLINSSLFCSSYQSASSESTSPSQQQQNNIKHSSYHIQLYQLRQLLKTQRYIKKLSQQFDTLTIINKKQLPVKSMNLKHYENHFVVVSLTVVEEGLHFLSVGKKTLLSSQVAQNPTTTKATKQPQPKYRLCLISAHSKTILQCVILSNKQSFPVYLPQEEFQIYISAYNPSQDLKNDQLITSSQKRNNKHNKNTNTKNQLYQQQQQARQIMDFTLYIQSAHIAIRHDYLKLQSIQKRQLQFELRLKQEYKTYTSMIVQQFIRFSFLQEQIQKMFNQLCCCQRRGRDNDACHKQQQDLINKPLAISKSCENYDQQGDLISKNGNYQLPEEQSSYDCSNRQDKICNQQQLIQDQILTVDQFMQSNNSNNIRLKETLNILRIHLKALDLYIDCVNTKHDGISSDNQSKNIMNSINLQNRQSQAYKIYLSYSKNNLLCDMTQKSNTIQLTPSSINLIYLMKDSAIEQIKLTQIKLNKQKLKIHLNSNSQNRNTQQQIFQTQSMLLNENISYRLFRKQW